MRMLYGVETNISLFGSSTVWRKYVQLDGILTAIRHETLLLIWGPVHHRPCCTYISKYCSTYILHLKAGRPCLMA